MNNKQHNYKTVLGIDLGDRKHYICVLDQAGNILDEFSINNTREQLLNLTTKYPDSLVAFEIGTHSPWISRLFQENNMEVIVANARKVTAIYCNERKTDQRDARMLAKLARLDPELLYPISHKSLEAQEDMMELNLRKTLVNQRSCLIVTLRSTLKSHGRRIKSCDAQYFVRHAEAELKDSPKLLALAQPIFSILDLINAEIKGYDIRIEELAKSKYPQAQRFRQIPGVGPICSLAYVLQIQDAERFEESRSVGAYLGLVPRKDQSGQIDKQLPISKVGSSFMRSTLVQSAQYILGRFGPDCELRRFGLKIMARGGAAAKKKATIAVARKLAVMMHSMWKHQTDYQPLQRATSISN